jgi:hypothetical protein
VAVSVLCGVTTHIQPSLALDLHVEADYGQIYLYAEAEELEVDDEAALDDLTDNEGGRPGGTRAA